MKKIAIAALAAATMLTFSMSLFADSTGWRQNSTGWWYATNNAGTTWYSNGWQWIDGNNDGIAECYYFDSNGYALTNTTTPDGYTVDANGAWTVNGVVQVQTRAKNIEDVGTDYSDFDWKFEQSSKCLEDHEGLKVSKYLGLYRRTEGEYTCDYEFALLSDGTLHNNFRFEEAYAYGVSRVSDTKWEDTRANITRCWEILDNGEKIRNYSIIGGKFNSDSETIFYRID